MNELILDIETNGLPVDYRGLITDSNNWPRVVQIGFVVIDRHGKEMMAKEFLIRPDGWEVGATHIHGITQEMAETEGVPITKALTRLTAWAHTCGSIICHNADFDLAILQSEYYRNQMLHCYRGKRIYCTMKQTTNLVKLRKKQGSFTSAGYKWPKLTELMEYCNLTAMGVSHTALADAKNTARCYNVLNEIHPTAFNEVHDYPFLSETIGDTPTGKDGLTTYVK